MNHTHYALFKAYESGLVAILPKDFNDTTLCKAIKDEEGVDVEGLSYDEGMVGREDSTIIYVELEDGVNTEYNIEPTWLYENE